MDMQNTMMTKQQQSGRKRKLSTEITVVIVIKLVILYGLWWVWIAPNRVEVNADKMFNRVESTSASESIKEQ